MKPHWLLIFVTVPIRLHIWLPACCCCCCCCCSGCGCVWWWCICCWNGAVCWLFPAPNAFWFIVDRVLGYWTVWLNIAWLVFIAFPPNIAKLFWAAAAATAAAVAAFWCWAIARFWLKFWKPTKFGLIICDWSAGWPALPNEFRCHGGFEPPPNDMPMARIGFATQKRWTYLCKSQILIRVDANDVNEIKIICLRNHSRTKSSENTLSCVTNGVEQLSIAIELVSMSNVNLTDTHNQSLLYVLCYVVGSENVDVHGTIAMPTNRIVN